MIRNLHSALVEEIRVRKPEYLTESFSVAEIYQNLIPYRTHRDALGVEMNADYEDALLRLLAGEGDLLILESEAARQEIREELETGNPNTSYYREYAAAAVRLNPAHLPAESLAAMLSEEPEDVSVEDLDLDQRQELEEPEPFDPGAVASPAEEPASAPSAPEDSASAPEDSASVPEASAPVPEDSGSAAEEPVTDETTLMSGDELAAKAAGAISPEEFFMAARANGSIADPNNPEPGDDAPVEVASEPTPEEPLADPVVAELIGMGFETGISMEGGMTLAETLMADESGLTPPVVPPPADPPPREAPPEDTPPQETPPTEAELAPVPEEVAEMDEETMPEIEETAAAVAESADDIGTDEACDSCSSPLPDREVLNFCPFCGLDLRVFPCGNCGESVEFGWKFCVACGQEAAPARG